MLLPPHVQLRDQHPTQASLDLLDAGLVLCWNARITRYEVWRREFGQFRRADGRLGRELRMDYQFILRAVAEDQSFMEPGEWLIAKLRERDSRFRDPKDAWATVKAELDADERRGEDEIQRKLDEARMNVIETYLPLWRKKADPDEFAREYKDWDPEPVHFAVSRTTPMREAIRAEAK